MTYTWDIIKLATADKTNDNGEYLANAIISVKWRKNATDENGNRGSYVSETKIDIANTSAADFIELDNVTKADVISWIESALSDSDKNAINKILQTKVEKEQATTITPNW